MKHLLTLAALCSLLLVASATDQCSGFSSCGSCLANKFCGWCSPSPVVYADGTLGHRCADQRDGKWDCFHLYQTSTCVAGYVCNAETAQCELTVPGEGDRLEDCQAGCHKAADVYKCNSDSMTCELVPSGTPGATSLDICSQQCHANYACNKESYGCDPVEYGTGIPLSECETQCQVHNNTPIALVGNWRGLQISNGNLAGEWDFFFGEQTLTVVDPSNVKTTAMLSSFVDELEALVVAGSQTGGRYRMKYSLGGDGPETRHMTLAVGVKDSRSPKDFEEAMVTEGQAVFVLAACKDGVACKFDSIVSSLRPTLSSSLQSPAPVKAGNSTDRCNVHTDCSSCLGASLCGWCSAPVVYDDGSKGFQCAGFDEAGQANPPYKCFGLYKRTDCADYACDTTTMQCKLVPEGTGTSREACENSCKEGPVAKVYRCDQSTTQCEEAPPGTPGASSLDICQLTCSEIKPHNTTPADMQGEWRGLAVQLGYTKGEYVFVATENSVEMRSLSGAVVFVAHASTGSEGSDVVFQVTQGPYAGKSLYGLFQLTSGPETLIATLALKPNAAPVSFDAAMQEGLVFVLLKCLDGKPCSFHKHTGAINSNIEISYI